MSANTDSLIAELEERLAIAEQEKFAAQQAIKNAENSGDDAVGDAAIKAVGDADAEIAAIKAEIAAITAASAKGGRRKRSHRSKRRILKKRHTRRKQCTHLTHRKHRK